MMMRNRHDETIGWNIIDRAIIVGGVYKFCFLNNIHHLDGSIYDSRNNKWDT